MGKQETELEYASLKAFFTVFVDRYVKADLGPPDERPLAVIEAQEKKSRSKALIGLRMAINDCVEMSSGFSPAEVEKLDAELHGRGIVTLSELRRRYSRGYRKVLKRGWIGTDAEFSLIQNVLNDGTEKSAEDIEALVRLIDSYEAI